ncbi:2OG-Fe(II) oxygenase [Altericroceibacterium spongiae]|uniref:2OG-Fe(II) oxygenase n=1 Tax=Altericroceibacterium spongiae TaxID=2320269 RepID=A0A420EKH0_9SPHN|nr:2OG-Fe(II) oxygenase [Altericroceibacterium spongiae]RKF21150.1 2OG-Fe(II) oxygenase [Altericroceibacterium spongiae]
MFKQTTTSPDTIPDQAGLAAIGAQVRQRLDANPQAYRVPNDHIELYAVGDFLDARECDRLIAMIDQVAQPSATFEDGKSSHRTSYSGNVNPHDPFIKKVQRRFDDLLGIDPTFGETMQGQRYEPGQEFRTHCDWFYPEGNYWPAEQKRGGQRSITAMVFLNDVEEGGTTDFPHLGISIAPQRGALLIWNNADREGKPSTWTAHAGTPVVKGVKYIITKWYRTRRWG